jgi:cobyric acid synthase
MTTFQVIAQNRKTNEVSTYVYTQKDKYDAVKYFYAQFLTWDEANDFVVLSVKKI